MMTAAQALIAIALIAVATLLTRALPFLLFPANKKTPAAVLYLGKVLPYAIIGMLVVYCLKDVSPGQPPYGMPEALGIAIVAGLYYWRGNTLLAIAGGTVAYMLLLQRVFV